MLVTAALHEAGHGIVAQAFGFAPRIYAFYEDNPTGTATQTLLILAAGPIASLVLGGIFLALYHRQRAHYSFWRLFLFWLGWGGIMEFVNYLVVTPWLSAGDTARFAAILHWPLWVRYAVCVVGIVAVVALGRLAATTMFALAPRGIALETKRDRRRFVIGVFYMPLLAGVALSAVAGIGGRLVIVALGAFASLGSIDIVVSAMYAGGALPTQRREDAPIRIEPAAISLYVALVALYVFVFSRGMPI